MGASQWWILRKHIWSKVLPTIAVTAAQAIGAALLVVASLTFLGLGVTPPAPTWGGMLASDLGYLAQQPWAPLFPGLLIMLTVGALNLLADAIRDQRRTASAAPGRGRPGPAVAATSGLTGGGRARRRPRSAGRRRAGPQGGRMPASPLPDHRTLAAPCERPRRHRRRAPPRAVRDVSLQDRPRRVRRPGRRVRQRQDPDLPLRPRPAAAGCRRRRRPHRLGAGADDVDLTDRPAPRWDARPRRPRSPPSSRTRRPTSTRRSPSGHQLAELLRVNAGCPRPRPTRAASSCSPRSGSTTRTGSTTSTRTSSRAACSSAS